MWLIDTGAVRTILSHRAYASLPNDGQNILGDDPTPMFLADGRQLKTYGMVELCVQFGTQAYQTTAVVADI